MAPEQQKTDIGELIDTLIEQERSRVNQGLTMFIDETVSRKSSLSSRQIGRIRTISSDFPEGEAVEKLSLAIPQISILKPSSIVNRLLWDWVNIQYDQEVFISEIGECKQTIVSIFSGWQPPIGLSNEDVVRSIARNIRMGFAYVFIYPDPKTYPGNDDIESVKAKIMNWIEELRNNVSLAWINENKAVTDRKQLSQILNDFLEELDEKIKFTQANESTDLWLRLPSNYCILYNLGISNMEDKFKYGSFKVTGQLVRSLNPIDSVTSDGWLYTTDDQYKLIEQSYKQAVPEWRKLIPKSSNLES